MNLDRIAQLFGVAVFAFACGYCLARTVGFVLDRRREVVRPEPDSLPTVFDMADVLRTRLPSRAVITFSLRHFERKQVEGFDPEVDIQIAYHTATGRKLGDLDLVFFPDGEKVVRVAEGAA